MFPIDEGKLKLPLWVAQKLGSFFVVAVVTKISCNRWEIDMEGANAEKCWPPRLSCPNGMEKDDGGVVVDGFV